MKRLILSLFILSCALSISSQTYEMKTDNFTQLDETTIQWELWLKKASGADFGLYTWQLQWTFDNNILNTGSFTNANFTVSPGADAVFLNHYNNADAVVPGPGQYFSHTPSSFPNTGEFMTLITEDWKHIATYTAQLSKSGSPHNFASAEPDFAHRIGGIVEVFAADNPYAGPGTQQPISGTLTTAEGVSINDRELAGYWFTGEGDWDEAARWNNVTAENNNTIPPGTASNIGIDGSAILTDARTVNELIITSKTIVLPTVETGTVSFFLEGTFFATNADNNVVNEGDSPVTSRGVVVANTISPVISSAGVVNFPGGIGVGTYPVSGVPGPIQGTWYYRAYATNSSGTAYGQARLVSDNSVIGAGAVGGPTPVDGSLIIEESGQLTTLDLFNDAGQESLIIQSTATGTGSLIHNNTGVTATIERYIAAANWGVEGDGWHLLSSPVALQTIEGDWTPSGSGNNFDFYGFSEPEQAWINFKNTTEPPTWAVFNGPDFTPGRGYLVAYEQAGTKTFTGPVNVENVANIPITRSGIPDDNNHYGWNLVGNPFASALTWTGSVAGNNLGGVAKVWDETTMAYVDITAGSAIPSANGFFVSATEATGIVSLHSFNRVHSSQNWYKSNDERILLVAGDQQGNSAQQSVIRFNDEATPGYDANFDAYFMAGYAPMFYSVAEEKRFSTNTLPEMSSGMSIPFGFHKNSHADFFIEMQESIDDVIIYLTDLKEDVTQNLSEEPVYYFSASADDDPDRFVISFATVSVPEVLKKGLLQAYTYGDMLYVLNPSANAIVELYGVQGQLIMSREIGQGINSIPVTVPGGTYIVKMVNADETATRKVVIN